MADEPVQEAPDVVQDTPEVEVQAPETDKPGEDTVEYWKAEAERRSEAYNTRRSDFDRAQQQNAEYERLIANLSDEEIGPQLLPEVAPYLYKEEEDDDSDDDPYLTREEFQQTLQQQQDAQVWQAVQGHVSQLAEQEGLELSDRQKSMLAREAYEAGATPDKTESLSKEFFAELSQFGDKYIERYRESKQGPQAPGGTAAVKQEDLDTPQAREEHMSRRIQEIESAHDL